LVEVVAAGEDEFGAGLTTHCWTVVRGCVSVGCSILDYESSMGRCAGAGILGAFCFVFKGMRGSGGP
jgi:hypothetical protein